VRVSRAKKPIAEPSVDSLARLRAAVPAATRKWIQSNAQLLALAALFATVDGVVSSWYSARAGTYLQDRIYRTRKWIDTVSSPGTTLVACEISNVSPRESLPPFTMNFAIIEPGPTAHFLGVPVWKPSRDGLPFDPLQVVDTNVEARARLPSGLAREEHMRVSRPVAPTGSSGRFTCDIVDGGGGFISAENSHPPPGWSMLDHGYWWVRVLLWLALFVGGYLFGKSSARLRTRGSA
jgi:hypothetical protein